MEKSTSCQRNEWFGWVAAAVGGSANSVDGSADAVQGEDGGKCGGSGCDKGGEESIRIYFTRPCTYDSAADIEYAYGHTPSPLSLEV